MRRVVALIVVCLIACTIQANIPQPVITIDCVVIELPGGNASVMCPDASTQDGGGV